MVRALCLLFARLYVCFQAGEAFRERGISLADELSNRNTSR